MANVPDFAPAIQGTNLTPTAVNTIVSTNASSIGGNPVANNTTPSTNQGLVWNGSAWAPANIVNSWNTRTGAVVPTTGDYTAAQVTNAADKSSGSQQLFSGDVGTGAGLLTVGATAGTDMHVTGTFASALSATTGNAFTVTVAGDTTGFRLTVTGDGTIHFGPGNGALDSSFGRLAASVLGTAADAISTGPTSQSFTGSQTTGVFIGTGNGITAFNSVTFSLINSSLTTDTFARFGINSSGLMQWGTGAAALDTQMSRLGVGVLGMASGDSFTTNALSTFTFGQQGVALQAVGTVWAAAAAAGNNTYVSSITGDTERRLGIQANGGLVWGPGNAATDVSLIRAAKGSDVGMDMSGGTATSWLQLGGSLYSGQVAATTIASAGTWTPDYGAGQFQTATMATAGATTMTIAASTNTPSTTRTGWLALKVKNTAGSGGVTITWNAQYTFSTVAAFTSVTFGTFNIAYFVWDSDASVWRCVAKYT